MISRAELEQMREAILSVATVSLRLAERLGAELASAASHEVRTSMPEVRTSMPEVVMEDSSAGPLAPALQLHVAVCAKCLRRFGYFGPTAPSECGDCPAEPLGVA